MVDSNVRFSGGGGFEKFAEEKISDEEEDVGYQSLGRNIKVMYCTLYMFANVSGL